MQFQKCVFLFYLLALAFVSFSHFFVVVIVVDANKAE